MSIFQSIQNELTALEREEDVRILLAVESGSRAWGFHSVDSDYDVRFIYLRTREYYLRLDKQRDVIQWKLNDTLDISGWDITKALRLLHSSNPTLFEWMNSPLVYLKHPESPFTPDWTLEYFQMKPHLHHYLNMARNNYRENGLADNVVLKKYLYTLRPILACRYILSTGKPPPMPMMELVETQLEPSLITEVMELLEIKRQGLETGTSPRRQNINDYIDKSLVWIESEMNQLPSGFAMPWQPLNEALLRTLDLQGHI